jgi:transcriptional regulator with XRE-family HTH domain
MLKKLNVSAKGKREAIDLALAKRIRVLRVAKGMSQTALGEALGVTYQQMQKYEAGMNRIGAGRLHKLANTLGVSINELFDLPKTESAKIGEMIDTQQIARLITAFKALPGGHRTAVVRLIEMMAGTER